MTILTNELKAKLLAARSAREAAALLRDAGVDAPLAERLWTELKHKREADGKELSLDELGSVSGGFDRDWLKEGCAATVEPYSWCGSDDACLMRDVVYAHQPVGTCSYCGGYQYSRPSLSEYVCSKCGKTEKWNTGL